MIIGIYSPYLHTMSGGERYMLTVAEYLSREHRVDIFWDDNGIQQQARKKLLLDLTRVHIVPNIFDRKNSIILKLRKSRRYDLIIFLSDGSIPISAATKNILHFQRPFPAVRGNSITTRLKLRAYQKVVCNSVFTKRWIDRVFGLSSEVIYPPVPVDDFSPGKKKERIILSVGRFHPLKKQDILVSVFSALHPVLSKWRLVMIGGLLESDRWYFKNLEEKSAGLPVDLIPNASFQTLKKHYAKARFYWHGTGFGENESVYPEAMEHFGISTVEAMAAGCIPLAFRGGGQVEIIDHEKTGILWETEEELVKKTISLVKNPSKVRAMRKRCIKKSKEYSADRFCRSFDKLIKEVTKNL